MHTAIRCRTTGAIRHLSAVAGVGLLAILLASCERRRDSSSAGDSARLVGAVVPAETARSGVPVANAALDYTPPADSLIPEGELGVSIRRGLALIVHTTDSLPRHAPGSIQCASCHVNAGRRRGAASLIGVTARYPKYLDRSGAVIPIEDRVNHCVTRSLAGNRIPDESREMKDIVAYLTFLSTGVPPGSHVKGEGMPKMPRLSGDTARGAQLFTTTCALCHGAQGQGNPPAFPALWGPRSYSIGASMARGERAATFIRHFMPQNKPGSLTDQQAYDVAAFINSQPRPDSPQKERDWPKGGAPQDVPYNTVGHTAYRPPARLIPRANPAGAIVPPPNSNISAGAPGGRTVLAASPHR
jgi:thiosulfate dehydrogenase